MPIAIALGAIALVEAIAIAFLVSKLKAASAREGYVEDEVSYPAPLGETTVMDPIDDPLSSTADLGRVPNV